MDVIQPLIFVTITFLLIVVFLRKLPSKSSVKKPAILLAGCVLIIAVTMLIVGILPLLELK
jgi:predicted permease